MQAIKQFIDELEAEIRSRQSVIDTIKSLYPNVSTNGHRPARRVKAKGKTNQRGARKGSKWTAAQKREQQRRMKAVWRERKKAEEATK
jgi:hypothetical protein